MREKRRIVPAGDQGWPTLPEKRQRPLTPRDRRMVPDERRAFVPIMPPASHRKRSWQEAARCNPDGVRDQITIC
jgi:transposase